jgi:hypothetical protein
MRAVSSVVVTTVRSDTSRTNGEGWARVSRGQGQMAAVAKARGLGFRDRGRCAHIFCSHCSRAAAAAGVGANNAISSLMLTSGGDCGPSWRPFLCPSMQAPSPAWVALGLRPEVCGQSQAATPDLDPNHREKLWGETPRGPHQTQKKTTAGLLCTRMIAVPCEAHFENGS